MNKISKKDYAENRRVKTCSSGDSFNPAKRITSFSLTEHTLHRYHAFPVAPVEETA